MDLKLKVLDGKHIGQEIPVTGPKFLIGRGEDCHLRPGSDAVSRHHCVILVDETYVGVRDFGSKNGTMVNGERVIGEREIKHGDRVTIGPLQFQLVVNHKLGGKKRSAVHDVKEAVARTAEGTSTGEIDVTQWLGQPATGDTQRVRLEETIPVQPGVPLDAPAPSTAAADAPDPPAAAPGEKKAFGKLPPKPAVTAKDSRDAATQMLEQLRKRR